MPFGRDRPEHICQIFPPETTGGREMAKAGINYSASGLRFHRGIALRFRQKHRASEIDRCRAVAVLVIDSLNRALHYGYAVKRYILARSRNCDEQTKYYREKQLAGHVINPPMAFISASNRPNRPRERQLG